MLPLHAVEDGPRDAPTVVLLCSIGTTIDMWAPQRRELAADHNVVDVSNLIASATVNIIPIDANAIPRPAFSNVTHTTSPRLQPYATVASLPPAERIACACPS